MGKKVLTEDMENFILNNHDLLPQEDIAYYLDIDIQLVQEFCQRKKLKTID